MAIAPDVVIEHHVADHEDAAAGDFREERAGLGDRERHAEEGARDGFRRSAVV